LIRKRYQTSTGTERASLSEGDRPFHMLRGHLAAGRGLDGLAPDFLLFLGIFDLGKWAGLRFGGWNDTNRCQILFHLGRIDQPIGVSFRKLPPLLAIPLKRLMRLPIKPPVASARENRLWTRLTNLEALVVEWKRRACQVNFVQQQKPTLTSCPGGPGSTPGEPSLFLVVAYSFPATSL